MTPPRGGAREGSGPKPLRFKRRLLSFRCSLTDWNIIKKWHDGDAEKRAQTVLELMKSKDK